MTSPFVLYPTNVRANEEFQIIIQAPINQSNGVFGYLMLYTTGPNSDKLLGAKIDSRIQNWLDDLDDFDTMKFTLRLTSPGCYGFQIHFYSGLGGGGSFVESGLGSTTPTTPRPRV
ncbi:hypothetical protein F5B19DRAFT_480970 [Rostrohypoxylon terebratum]|nr:hypothetical protein F5B19DRAFT_480970 [Rostrohypoxylon terebratum]